MTTGARIFKQSAFLLIFLIIIGLFSFFVWRISSSEPVVIAPTPTPLFSIETLSTKILKVGDSGYDILIKARNPNPLAGVARADYSISLIGQDDTEVGTVSGYTYFSPGQTKFIVVSPIDSTKEIKDAIVSFNPENWSEDLKISPSSISLIPLKYDLSFASVPGSFASVKGTLRNVSDYNLNKVDLVVMLFDKNGEVFRVGRSSLRTLLAKENRDFSITWFNSFSETVDRIEVEAYTNVSDEQNFIKSSGDSVEKFQEMQ